MESTAASLDRSTAALPGIWSGSGCSGLPWTDAPSGQGMRLGGLAVAPADRIMLVDFVIAHRAARSVLGADPNRCPVGNSVLGGGRHRTLPVPGAVGVAARRRIS